MNDETAALLFDVVERLERSIAARDCPAMVAVEGRKKLVLSDFDYLRDRQTAEDFERRAATKADEVAATRWVFAVPQVWYTTADTISTRAVSNHPLREGEQEAITWMSFDRENGIDYGRVIFTRRPDGTPVFAEPELLTVAVRPATGTPGSTLLRTVMERDSEAPGQ